MKKLIFCLLFLCMALVSSAQLDFVAQQNGDWEDGATWGNTSPGTEGIDFPGQADNVYTSGFEITVSGTVDCNNLYVQFDVENGLNFSSSSRTIQVHGTLVGWDGDDGGAEEIPEVDVIDASESAGRLRFIGDGDFFDGGENIIFSWSADAPIYRILCDFDDPNLTLTFEDAEVMISAGGSSPYFRVDDGKVEIPNGSSLSSIGGSSTLRTLSGGSLSIFSPVSGFDILDVDSDSEIIAFNYLNSNTAIVDGILETKFDGINQTQGWWLGDNIPGSLSVGSTSTIKYTAFNAQQVFAKVLGNLELGGSGTKILSASGTLEVLGDFAISTASVTFDTSDNSEPIDIFGNIDNDGTWEPTQLVRFNGTGSSQVVGGNNPIVFKGGLSIGEEGIEPSSLILLNATVDIDSDLNIYNNATLDLSGNNITLTGDWTNNGIFSNSGSGAGTVTFDGTGSSSVLGSTTTSFNNVIIASGKTLDQSVINATDSLNVQGTWTNNGTFEAGTGTVVFNGVGTQSLNGSSTTTFNNIYAQNNISNDAILEQSGILTLDDNVDFDADGLGSGVYNLLSTASGDACIASIPSTSSVSGVVNAQRYMEGEGRIYRYISSPIANAPVSALQDDFPITGTFTGADEIPGLNSMPSMFDYTESASGDFQQGWESYPEIVNTETLVPGRGYAVFIREEVNPTTIDISGTINQGDFNFDVTYNNSGNSADGWNLVGNPYPCDLDWNSGSWTRTNVAGTVYIRDNGNGGVFTSYDGVVGLNGGERYIASGQAFWVQATSAGPVMSITEEVKSAQSATFFRTGSVANLLKVALGDGSGDSDETAFRFIEGATKNYDVAMDSKKLENPGIFNFSSYSEDGKKLAINYLPELSCGSTIVPLDIADVDEGNHKLLFTGLSSFDNLATLQLMDAYAGEMIDIDGDIVYDFTIDEDIASMGSERFKLVFTGKGFVPEIIEEDGILRSSIKADIQWYFNDEPIEGGNSLTIEATASGIYTLEVTKGECTGAVSRTVVVTALPEESSAEKTTFKLSPNPASERVEIFLPVDLMSGDNVLMELIDRTGRVVSKRNLTREQKEWKGSFNLRNYAKGIYFITIFDGDSRISEKLVIE